MLNIVDENNKIKSDFKKIFSSNVFIPMDNNVSEKSFSYFTGFIKWDESLKIKQMVGDYIYIMMKC